LHSQIDIAN